MLGFIGDRAATFARWAPECPDCGYLIRGLERPRCPECGVVFPSRRPYFRRWASRRPAWDRVKRGQLVSAYIRTLMRILLCPWGAARGLVIADHWRRCARWAAVHLLASTTVAALVADGQYFARWFAHWVSPPSYHAPGVSMPCDAPFQQVSVWLLQSFVAWGLPFVVPVVIAGLLSVGLPRQHRAAKVGGLKWSLYLTGLLLPTVGGWYVYWMWNPPLVQVSSRVTFAFAGSTPDIPSVLVATVYGVWWAAGMAANAYNRVRGIGAFVRYVLLYAAAWTLVTQVLFRAGAAGALL